MKRSERKLSMDVALALGGLLDAMAKPEFMNLKDLQELFLATTDLVDHDEDERVLTLVKAYRTYIYELIKEEDPR